MQELEQKKFTERFDWAIMVLKERAKKENIPFDKDLFREASEIARMLFVRSEIAYTNKK